jgi:hypothetical protein
MQHFKPSGRAQEFLPAHAFLQYHRYPWRLRLGARAFPAIRSPPFNAWHQKTCVQTVEMTPAAEPPWTFGRRIEVDMTVPPQRLI